MEIGKTYEVIVGERKDGTFEKVEMELKEIMSYEGKKIYIFKDEMSYDFVTYNYENEIDWDFMEIINDKFGY